MENRGNLAVGKGKIRVYMEKQYGINKPLSITSFSPHLATTRSLFDNQTSITSNPPTFSPTSTPFGSPASAPYHPPSPCLSDPFARLPHADNDPLHGVKSLDLNDSKFFDPSNNSATSSSADYSTRNLIGNEMETDM